MVETKEVDVVICLGSNTTDRHSRLRRALSWLATSIKLDCSSSIYDTPPYSGVGGEYSNAVVKGSSALGFEELESLCKSYEVMEGRDTDCRLAGIVPIDVDIVIYDGEAMRPGELSRYYFTQGYNQIS